MRHLDACLFVLLSFGLMGSACRKDEKPKELPSIPEAQPSLFGSWEVQLIRSAGDTIDLRQLGKEPIYLSLNEDGSAQWFRGEADSLEYCEADVMALGFLADQIFFNQHAFKSSVTHDRMSLFQGALPADIVMLTDLLAEFAPFEMIELEAQRISLDLSNAQPTQSFATQCQHKSQALLPPPTVSLPEPLPAITNDPVQGPIDDTDAVLIPLVPIGYRVMQGRPLLFEEFDKDRDLAAISVMETGRTEYLKIQNSDQNNVRLEIDFEWPRARFDAIRVQTHMHSDSSGQFRPARFIQIRTQDKAEPLKWLDRLAASQPGLGNKDVFTTTTLRRSLGRYGITEGGRSLLRIVIELDYSAISSCRILGFVPCWERPALYIDYVGVDLIKFPGDQDQLSGP